MRSCRPQPPSSSRQDREPARLLSDERQSCDMELRLDSTDTMEFPQEHMRLRMSPSRLLFGSTVFLASFLLFLVEPIAAKQLLPVFGGSAAVWITCLVFFQTALLVAYLYAHWLAQHRSRSHRMAHWIMPFCSSVLAAASAIAWSIHTINLASTRPIASIFLALEPLHRTSLPHARRNQPAVAGLACAD